jgi:hypothetical protein
MFHLGRIRAGGVKAARALHQDEEGLNTIELVLILCVAAFVLYSAYKLLWADGKTGTISAYLDSILQRFTAFLQVNVSNNTTGK